MVKLIADKYNSVAPGRDPCEDSMFFLKKS